LDETEGLSPSDVAFIFTEAQDHKKEIRKGIVNSQINNLPSAINQFDWNVKVSYINYIISMWNSYYQIVYQYFLYS